MQLWCMTSLHIVYYYMLWAPSAVHESVQLRPCHCSLFAQLVLAPLIHAVRCRCVHAQCWQLPSGGPRGRCGCAAAPVWRDGEERRVRVGPDTGAEADQGQHHVGWHPEGIVNRVGSQFSDLSRSSCCKGPYICMCVYMIIYVHTCVYACMNTHMQISVVCISFTCMWSVRSLSVLHTISTPTLRLCMWNVWHVFLCLHLPFVSSDTHSCSQWLWWCYEVPD